jgi:hypothetical protein
MGWICWVCVGLMSMAQQQGLGQVVEIINSIQMDLS